MGVKKINANHRFLLRDAKKQDIDQIFELGKLLNTINLPANRDELAKVIERSSHSFSLNEKDVAKRSFLFALYDTHEEKVIGVSQVFAKHGTLHFPQIYFQVSLDERYSKTLNKYFRHRVLRLMRCYDGPTELGSLVLFNKYRSHKEKLGMQLSFVRFLFMAMKRELFSYRVVAELLPPLGKNFESALWDAVGKKFTGLSYYDADVLSRNNREFIETLFPRGDIYVSLLPKEAQDVIGEVGPSSKGAAYLLSKIGFRYSHIVDPFDGGPHFEANQDTISLLKDTSMGKFKIVSSLKNTEQGLVASFDPRRNAGKRFMATFAKFSYNEDSQIEILNDTFNFLEAHKDISAACLP